MVQLDSRLPILGIPADIPGSFQRGLEFRERRRQIGENRQISDLFQSQGPALLRGDRGALDKLSRVDPQAAQGLGIGAQKLDKAQRERELFQARRALVLARGADTPEKWDAVARKAAPGLVGQFARRDEFIAQTQATIKALSGPGKTEIRTLGNELLLVTTNPDLTASVEVLRTAKPTGGGGAGGGGSTALEKRAIAGGLTPGTPEFQSFMLRGGRERFRVINDPVTKRLVVFDIVEQKIIGDAPEGSVPDPEPLAPEDTLFSQTGEATGFLSTAGAVSSSVLGQLPGALGQFFFFDDIVKARKAFDISSQAMLQAFVVNPKFNVAEVERIKKEIGTVTGAFTSPREMRTNLMELDRFLRRKIASQLRVAADPRLPTKEQQAAATNARLMQEYLLFMGVPQDGTPANPIDEGDGITIERIN